MTMIEIDDLGVVWCYPDGASKKQCDPLGLYQTSSECGNCPIIDMCCRFENMLYGDGGDGVVNLDKVESECVPENKETGTC